MLSELYVLFKFLLLEQLKKFNCFHPGRTRVQRIYLDRHFFPQVKSKQKYLISTLDTCEIIYTHNKCNQSRLNIHKNSMRSSTNLSSPNRHSSSRSIQPPCHEIVDGNILPPRFSSEAGRVSTGLLAALLVSKGETAQTEGSKRWRDGRVDFPYYHTSTRRSDDGGIGPG